jgi:hypothetical protein
MHRYQMMDAVQSHSLQIPSRSRACLPQGQLV